MSTTARGQDALPRASGTSRHQWQNDAYMAIFWNIFPRLSENLRHKAVKDDLPKALASTSSVAEVARSLILINQILYFLQITPGDRSPHLCCLLLPLRHNHTPEITHWTKRSFTQLYFNSKYNVSKNFKFNGRNSYLFLVGWNYSLL